MPSKSVLIPFSLIFFIMGGTTIAYLLSQESDAVYHTDIDVNFSLRIGETGVIESQGIRLKFLDVLEDSRCPSDVECFWEGTVSLLINIKVNAQNLGNFVLNASNLHKASFQSYYVLFLELSPYPISKQIISKNEYQATFKVAEYGLD